MGVLEMERLFSDRSAYAVMAYAVMAYAVMAYAVMAYAVMAYAVMAYVVMAYAVMAYAVMAYAVMAYVVMAYAVMAYVPRRTGAAESKLGSSRARIHFWTTRSVPPDEPARIQRRSPRAHSYGPT